MFTRKIGTCVSCGKPKVKYYKDHCQTCYIRLGLNTVKVVCAICGQKKAHRAKGLCEKCYQRRQREDPAYRKWKSDYMKKYNKEHAEEIREYARKYEKSHPQRRGLNSRKFGYLCGCGSIVMSAITNNTSKRGRKIKFPFCGRRDSLQPCYYNRFTREIVKMCEEE
jgi:hypothetical protein